jgi:predicted transposase/invertase (TIGR01784 family)
MGLLPKDADILPPYDDRLFKVIMTAPEAKPVLMLVTSEIIRNSVVDVQVRNTELPVSDINEKAQRFDVSCLVNDNSQVDIEMQASRMKDETDRDNEILRARSIYNLCDLHASQRSRGIEYNRLNRTYQVTFCGYPIYEWHPDLIYRFDMRHETGNWLLHDAIQAVFVGLTKLGDVIKKPVERMTDMEKFSIFLRYADKPDYRDIVNRVIETKEALAVAGEVLMSVSKDERERAILRNRRIAQMDYDSNMLTAERIGRMEGEKLGEERGLKIGEEKGRMEGKIEGERAKALSIAQSLLSTNLSIEEIAQATGLTRKEIEDLRILN